jgi:hypothetical protein
VLPSARAERPTLHLLPFQGRLTTSDGKPLTEGAAIASFSLYDASTGGTALWTSGPLKLTVATGGLVHATLGGEANPLEKVDFSNEVFLGVKVNDPSNAALVGEQPEMLPWVRILPVLYSFRAKQSQTADDAQRLVGHTWEAIFASSRENDPPVVRDSLRFAGHDWNEVNSLRTRIEALEKQITAQATLIAANKSSSASAHDRIGKISLGVAENHQGDFNCGHEHKMGPADSWVMYGSRDGTSCGVQNICYYKRLVVNIPPMP